MTGRGNARGLLTALLAAAALVGPAAGGEPAGEAPARWIVRFESPSLVRAAREGAAAVRRLPGGRLDLRDPEARRYLVSLDEEHARFRRELSWRLPGALVEREYRLLFNGMTVETRRPDVLERLPGVARVFAADTILYRPTLDASLPMLGAPDLWSAAGGTEGAGAGVRLAVIDSGIDPDNPFFRPDGMGMPAGYPLGAAAHTSAKVIAARAYFRPGDPVDTTLDEPNPRDHIGHGSHCAGIAAGRAATVFDVNGTPLDLSGVAPAAHLLNYKVFYRAESGVDGAYDSELMAAFEDAVADGADVISCSWGGPDPLVEVPSSEVYRAAVEAGVVVVFAAGNDGSGPGTIGHPGTLPEVLTVGSFDTGRGFAGRIDLASEDPLPAGLSSLAAVKGAISPDFSDEPLGPLPLVAAAMVGLGDNADGCEPFILDAFLGGAALIARGVCPFTDKARNAWLAGAEAVIVYNDVDGESAVVMGGDPAPIPAVQLGNADGIALEGWLLDHLESVVSVVLSDVFEPYRRPEEERRISSFSARGPTDRPLLKPEISAPGRSILSADARAVGVDGPDWGVKQGTSMAAPHVAGAAAVIRGIHPAASPFEVTGLLVGSARLDLTETPGVSALDLGAGQLDLARGAVATAGVVPAALSFGEGPQGTRFEGRLRLFDLAGSGAAARMVSWIHAHPDCTVVAPVTGTVLEPGGLVDLAIDCPTTATPGEYTGWMVLEGEGPAVVVPYHYRILPVRNRELLLLDMSFASTEESPLAAVHETLAEAAGLDWESYRVVAAAGPPPLAFLGRFATVLVFTGGDQVRYRQQAGWQTLDLLSSYARMGGNLIVAGQGPWRGSGHQRIGGLAGSATHPGYPLFDPYTLDLLVLDNYLARSFAGEVAIWGDFDLGPGAGGSGDPTLLGELIAQVGSGLPAVFTRPVLSMDAGPFAAGGRVGMVFDPYAGYGAYPQVESLRHRSAVLGFGFERVGDDGLGSATRQELFEGLHDWVSERILLSVAVEQSGTHVLVHASTTGAQAVEFEFDFGDGSAPVTSGYHQLWHEYDDLGPRTITVLARAALGAADVERVSVTLVEEPPAGFPDGGGEGETLPPQAIDGRVRDCACRAVGEPAGPRGPLGMILSYLIDYK
jgi:subtilisin family serine protease